MVGLNSPNWLHTTGQVLQPITSLWQSAECTTLLGCSSENLAICAM